MSPATTLCPVILAGGTGNRLWPLSRRHCPKQFLRLFGAHSLLQETLLRCARMEAGGVHMLPPMVICNETLGFTVAQQAAALDSALQRIVLEPVGRNTAPALTVAALIQQGEEDDPLLLALPSDQLLRNEPAFQQALVTGLELARDGSIVTFGIAPGHATSAYGYIKRAGKIRVGAPLDAFHVAAFSEKPDAVLAEKYIRSGRYYWNSGIFLVRASVWLEVIERLHPEIHRACTAACKNQKTDGPFFRLAEAAFSACPDASVDVAVMEKLTGAGRPRAVVVPMDCAWSDVGAWSEVWEQGMKDENNNLVSGDGLTVDTSNSLLYSTKRLVAALGCDNLVIVETADAVLVLSKDRSQDVRQLVDTLAARERREPDNPLLVRRPWGSYEVIEAGNTHQVKRLKLLPGGKISLQRHRRRSEHWVAVRGTATVTRGEDVFDLAANESTFIPAGMKHRLENRTEFEIEIIEVQIGDYLGEDDIVRFDDGTR